MSNLICAVTSRYVSVLRSWEQQVQFQPRLQDIFKSSTAKGDCGISSSESTFVVSTSETLSSIVGHGSKPISKNTCVHRLWDTPRRRTFLKILDINIVSGQTGRKWSKRIAINRSSLSLEEPKCPEIHIHQKTTLKIKLFWSLRDIGIGVCVKTQNRGVERR